MNKREFITRVVDELKQRNIRKSIHGRKEVLHITDDDGNQSDFVVKTSDKTYMFSIEDLTAIFDVITAVAEDAIKHGEEIAIHGFGALGVKYRLDRSTYHPYTGERCVIEGRYVPKFTAGKSLRTAAMIFGLSLDENQKELPEPQYDDFDTEDDD